MNQYCPESPFLKELPNISNMCKKFQLFHFPLLTNPNPKHSCPRDSIPLPSIEKFVFDNSKRQQNFSDQFVYIPPPSR